MLTATKYFCFSGKARVSQKCCGVKVSLTGGECIQCIQTVFSNDVCGCDAFPMRHFCALNVVFEDQSTKVHWQAFVAFAEPQNLEISGYCPVLHCLWVVFFLRSTSWRG